MFLNVAKWCKGVNQCFDHVPRAEMREIRHKIHDLIHVSCIPASGTFSTRNRTVIGL